jgi:hypothetical protein
MSLAVSGENEMCLSRHHAIKMRWRNTGGIEMNCNSFLNNNVTLVVYFVFLFFQRKEGDKKCTCYNISFIVYVSK